MLVVTIVLDGVGIGAQPDAAAYGDAGAHTLAHVCAAARPRLPRLAKLGLGRIVPLPHVPPAPDPRADFGKLHETSSGKDSTSGHWELAGLVLDRPFPTYPDGFPPEVVRAFLEETGLDGVLGNRAASGTEVIEELGPAHLRTGRPILYTSADSVFQLAAHVGAIPLDRQYAICERARTRVCTGEHAVGRVIARPFTGQPGAFRRLSEKRRDYALPPPAIPVQEALRRDGVATCSVGKVADLFAGVGFGEVHKTRSNEEGLARTRAAIRRLASTGQPAFIWTNLVDFDQEYGHRNDPNGFGRALEAFDRALPALLDALPPVSRLVITADHGNDPTHPGTDHTREYTPLLVYDPARAHGRDLGTRTTFADHAATLAAWFGVSFDCPGTSFL